MGSRRVESLGQSAPPSYPENGKWPNERGLFMRRLRTVLLPKKSTGKRDLRLENQLETKLLDSTYVTLRAIGDL